MWTSVMPKSCIRHCNYVGIFINSVRVERVLSWQHFQQRWHSLALGCKFNAHQGLNKSEWPASNT